MKTKMFVGLAILGVGAFIFYNYASMRKRFWNRMVILSKK
jgi:hypothetical protein